MNHRQLLLPGSITFLLFVLLGCVLDLSAQNYPVVKAKNSDVDVRIDKELYKSAYSINPSIKWDVVNFYVSPNGKYVKFYTDSDSISFLVKPDEVHRFSFKQNGVDTAYVEVQGTLECNCPRATFSEEYIKSHKGKVFVEVPEVYELVNIVFALTKLGRNDNNFIHLNTEYYKEVLKWFEPYSQERIVELLNFELADGGYSALKMDGYTFNISDQGAFQRSKIYDRIGNSDVNFLLRYRSELELFAKKSKFTKFYKDHLPYYKSLITTYRDSIGVRKMEDWLDLNFPSTHYDCIKIIFSPLVSANQSCSWFNFDGFSEVQAHVNFPFGNGNKLDDEATKIQRVKDGNILFTELNHGFIGPEAEKEQYRSDIKLAFENLETWNDMSKPAKGYNDAYSSFNEYMNWALVSLRYVDLVPKGKQDELIDQIGLMMTDRRGFKKFDQFNRYLVDLYRNREKGKVVADLYPDIVKWFVANK